MRYIAELSAIELTTFGPAGRTLREGIRKRIAQDQTLLAAPLAMLTGPDDLDPQVCTDDFRRRYLGER
jgi:hypothetical protein